jgi:hypothetical protein
MKARTFMLVVDNLLTAPDKRIFSISDRWDHFMVYLTDMYLAFSLGGSESNAVVSSIDPYPIRSGFVSSQVRAGWGGAAERARWR